MSLLSIVQNASREIGLDVPNDVIGNTDNNVAQMLWLAEKEGNELVARHDWQVLINERTFLALAQETQTAILPDGFDRFVSGTFYNRTQKRPVVGPLTPQEWQIQKSLTSTVVVDAFRRRGNDIIMIPNPPKDDTLAFEYVSKKWIIPYPGSAFEKYEFENDLDSIAFDERIVTLGVIWRYKAARGFDYAEEFRSYEVALARAIGDDGGKRIMDLGSPRISHLPFRPITPEGNWDLS